MSYIASPILHSDREFIGLEIACKKMQESGVDPKIIDDVRSDTALAIAKKLGDIFEHNYRLHSPMIHPEILDVDELVAFVRSKIADSVLLKCGVSPQEMQSESVHGASDWGIDKEELNSASSGQSVSAQDSIPDSSHQLIKLDQHGFGIIQLLKEDGTLEDIEVGCVSPKTVIHYGCRYGELRRRTAKLESIRGWMGLTGKKRLVLLYQKSELDNLFSQAIVQLDKNGCGIISLRKEDGSTEEVEVIGSTRKMGIYYAVDPGTVSSRLDGNNKSHIRIKPIDGHKGSVGRARYVPVYRKSTVDRLFLKDKQFDSRGCAIIQMPKDDGTFEDVEVVGLMPEAAVFYGISISLFRIKLKEIKPLPGVNIKAENDYLIYLYRKSEVDALFPKLVSLDGHGRGTIQLLKSDGSIENVEVIGSNKRAAGFYKISVSEFYKKLSSLNTIPHCKRSGRGRAVLIYRKSEVDALFR